MSNFIAKAKKKYGDSYDYSKMEEEKANLAKRKRNNRIAIIICNRCLRTFYRSKLKFLRGKGCKYCDLSKGERECKEALLSLGIKFTQQKRISFLKRRYYDFIFIYNNEKYALEYDGSQHFKENSYFKLKLKTIQKRDIIKTKTALSENYKVIRIDYKMKLTEIKDTINRVINADVRWDLWVSNYKLYFWLLKTI